MKPKICYVCKKEIKQHRFLMLAEVERLSYTRFRMKKPIEVVRVIPNTTKYKHYMGEC